MNHPTPSNQNPELDRQMRSIELARLKFSLQQKSLIAGRFSCCQCSDCAALRVKLASTSFVLTVAEAAVIIRELIRVDTDESLDLAGTICWATGEAFGARVDLDPKLIHFLDQSHAVLRSAIEAKRLLLWFHEELHKVTSSPTTVTSFPLHTDDGIISFDKDLRLRVKQAAVQFAKQYGLPKKD
ncbi:MAG: hypothetical protein U0930_22740 [Pirellulales bacterium]